MMRISIQSLAAACFVALMPSEVTGQMPGEAESEIAGTPEDEQAAEFHRGAVVPARGVIEANTLTELTRAAQRELKRHDYDLVAERRVLAIVRSITGGGDLGKKYTEKQLITIGRQVGVDLVVHPRVIAQSRAPMLLEVVSARVSRRTVWRCRRSLEVTDPLGTLAETAKQALEACMDQLLSPEPGPRDWRQELHQKSKPRKKKRKKKNIDSDIEWRKEHYIGLAGAVIPRGVQKVAVEQRDGDRLVGYIDYTRSGGVGLFYEKRVGRAFAAGVLAEYLFLWKEGASRTKDNFGDERLGLFDLGATLRLFYPGKWVEPYAKLILGFSFVGAPDERQNGTVLLDNGFGTNYQLRLGAMVTFPYVGFFVEFGLFATPWFPSDADIHTEEGEPFKFEQVTAVEAGMLFNFGLVATL